MRKPKEALVLRSSLVLIGVVIGWVGRTLTAPETGDVSPGKRPVGETRKVALRPPPLAINKEKNETVSIEPSGGVISSSIDPSFDFPAEWDALRCARESLNELNEYRRMQMFQRAMQRLTPETAARMQQEVFSECDKQGKWFIGEYQFFLRRWAEIDGRSAIEFASNRGRYDPNGWNGFIRQTLSGWAANDPEAAVSWINEKEDLDAWIVNAATRGVVDGLAERDPDRAVGFVLAQIDNPESEKLFRDLTENLIYGPGMARAEQWLTQIPEDPKFLDAKQVVFRHIIDRQMRGGVDEAAAFISRHASEPWVDQNSIIGVALEMSREPEKFERWKVSLPEGLVPKISWSRNSKSQ